MALGNSVRFSDENNHNKKIEIIIDLGPKKHKKIKRIYEIFANASFVHLNIIEEIIMQLINPDFILIFSNLKFF